MSGAGGRRGFAAAVALAMALAGSAGLRAAEPGGHLAPDAADAAGAGVAGVPAAPVSPAEADAAPAAAVPAESVAVEVPFLVESTLWLLPTERQVALSRRSPAEREAAAAAVLAADPLPATAANELAEGAARRRALALATSLTPFDDRARALFLLGAPDARQTIDCSLVYQPLEVWRHGGRELVLYRPATGPQWRLWSPARGKGELYTPQARAWMEDWHEQRGRRGGRLDRELCPHAKTVDRITGTDGLWPAGERHPAALVTGFAAPEDLAAWAAAAAATPVPSDTGLPVRVRAVELAGTRGTRVDTRIVLELPPGAPLAAAPTEAAPEVRVGVEGVVERDGEVLDEFRMRFPLPPPAAGEPLPLVVERPLRAGRYTVRLRVRDEVGGASAVLERQVVVAALPVPPPPAGAPATGLLAAQLDHGAHAVALLVPPEDVVFGNVPIQAVAVGPRVREVAFYVDGREQLRATVRPFAVTVELPPVPREVVVRADARDAEGNVLASDEVVVNRPRGALAVDLGVEPLGGDRVRAKVGVTVPPERRVQEVLVRVNEEEPVAVTAPAYSVELALPAEAVVFVTATAVLDDGSAAEAVEVVRDRWGGEALDVELVELLATFVDRGGNLVDGVGAGELAVVEQGRRQRVQRVIPAGDLPLTVGVALDASASMRAAMRQAQQAAAEFLAAVVGPRDRAFAVAFSARPQLLMPPTPDAGAVAKALDKLTADGWTALHDGIVYGLYHLRAVRGRRALVVLSDGGDNRSQVDYATALEHAKASGVVIYAIGLDTPSLDVGARRALRAFAEETGGRAFFVGRAEELQGTYAQIAEELRRQVLIAYAPDVPGPGAMQRAVEVLVERPGVRVRSVRGYAR